MKKSGNYYFLLIVVFLFIVSSNIIGECTIYVDYSSGERVEVSVCTGENSPAPQPTSQPTNAPTPVPTVNPNVAAAETALADAAAEQQAAQAGEKARAVKGKYDNAIFIQKLKQQTELLITANVKTGQNGINTTAEGVDPVMIATGVFTTEETDLVNSYGRLQAAVTRKYLGNNATALSFGHGWIFNFDTRIIRGVKPGAGEEAVCLQNSYTGVFSARQEQATSYNNLKSVLEAALTRAQAADTAAGSYVTAAGNGCHL